MPDAGTYSENFGEPFQRHLLAVAARHPSAVIRYRTVFHHTYFTSDLMRIVAKGLLAHVDQHKKLPTQTLLVEEAKAHASEKLFPELDKLVGFLWQDDISDAEATLLKAIEFGKLQAMANAILTGAGQIDAGDKSKIMGLVKEAERVGEDITDLGYDFTHTDRKPLYTESLYDDDYVTTGMSHVDRALGGRGGQRGCLYVILGTAKKGKSMSLANVGFGPLLSPKGYTVAHATCEMKRREVVYRYDARLSGKYFPLRKTDPVEFAKRINDRINTFIRGNLFVKCWNTRKCTVSNIRSWFLSLTAHGCPPDVAIIDYADIMKAERRLGEWRHEQAGIYEDLRELAGEFNAVCWTASQANKAALEKDTPDMGDFAESFEKAAIMDGGLAMCATSAESIEGRGRFFFMGLRDAPDKTTVEFTINKATCTIKTTGLFDESLMRIPIPEDDPDAADMPAQPIKPEKEKKNKPPLLKKTIGPAMLLKKPVPVAPAGPVVIKKPVLAQAQGSPIVKKPIRKG